MLHATYSKDTLGFKAFDCTEKQTKVNTFLNLLQDPDIQNSLKSIFETFLATSELKVLKRLSHLEELLGIDDTVEAPTIPERLEKLEARVTTPACEFKPPVEPTTLTECRAVAVVDHLKETGKDHLTAPEIFSFLKCKLPENCKINENIQNIRKVKQDVLKKAVAMYPNVFLSKKSTGHREVRLILAS